MRNREPLCAPDLHLGMSAIRHRALLYDSSRKTFRIMIYIAIVSPSGGLAIGISLVTESYDFWIMIYIAHDICLSTCKLFVIHNTSTLEEKHARSLGAWNNETSWIAIDGKSVISTSNQELSSRAPNLHLLFASKMFAAPSLLYGSEYLAREGGHRERRFHGRVNQRARRRGRTMLANEVSRGGGQFCASCTQRKQLQRPGGINKDFTGTNYRRFSAVLRRIPRWRKRQFRNARPRLLVLSRQQDLRPSCASANESKGFWRSPVAGKSSGIGERIDVKSISFE